MQVISIGTKVSQYGWVDIEEIESVPDIPLLQLVGLLVSESGASNVCNVLRDLKRLNGYKVRVTVEVLDIPDNRTDDEKLPRPHDHYSINSIMAREKRRMAEVQKDV